MNIVAIETTGPFCSVAVINDEGDLTELRGEERMEHLQTVTPMINALLDRNGLVLEDMDFIAVSEGPGSFTGIRIGVSTARALSQATGLRVLPIPTLYAFGTGEGMPGQLVCPLLDARRSQVYAGAYRDFETVVEGGPYILDEFLDKIKDEDDILFIGDGALRYQDTITAWAEESDKMYEIREVFQSAGNVAETAADLMEPCLLRDYGQVEPNYMRLPEAERKRLAAERQPHD